MAKNGELLLQNSRECWQMCVPKEEIISFNNIIDHFMLQQRYQVKESTYAHYMNLINTHIRPQLGEIPVNELSAHIIEAYSSEKLMHGKLDHRGGLSPKTVKDLLSLVRLIIKYGIAKGMINQQVLFFSGPRVPKKDVKVLSCEEQKRLEQFTLNSADNMCFGVYLCLYTGLRIGEICALRWKDIDLENACLHIDKTLLRIKNVEQNGQKTKILIDTPKTATSKRIIPVSSRLKEELLHRKKEIHCENIYFLTGTKNYIEPRNYYNKYKNYLEKCNLPPYTFHALRHTFATRCIEKGVDPKALSEILGHADVKITLDRYVHPSLEHKRNCMELLFSC